MERETPDTNDEPTRETRHVRLRSAASRRTVLRGTLAGALAIAGVGRAAAHGDDADESNGRAHESGHGGDGHDHEYADGDHEEGDEDDGNEEKGEAKNGEEPVGQLVSALDGRIKRSIESADVIGLMNSREASQNDDEPEPGEFGLTTLETIDGGADMRYEIFIGDSEDTEDVTQSHIHHADAGASDNRLFAFILRFTQDLDGSGGGSPATPPVTERGRLSELVVRNEDPEVPIDPDSDDVDSDDEDFDIEPFVEDLLDSPGEYISNVHTLEFQTESIRSQLQRAPDDLGDIDRDALEQLVTVSEQL